MTAKWEKTHCARFDHGGCGLEVLVEGGRAIAVRPDLSNPRSRGYACAKGLASIERHCSEHRLLHPLRRKGARGEGRWERISWDEAMNCISERLTGLKNASGAHTIAFAQGAPKGLEYLMLMRLANLFGTPNIAGTQHVCHMPRELMGRFTCGFMPVPDYENPTRCILLWGSNPFETNEEGILGCFLRDGLKSEETSLVVIDPYRTDLAERADVWLQIKPGADDVLALGLLHVIMEENLYDEPFVRDWTTGFEALRVHVKPYTPARVSEATWIAEDKIRHAARLYAKSHPALLHAGNSVENNGVNTAQTCRALVCLMAITGNLDVPGGNVQEPVPKVLSVRRFIAGEHLDTRPELSLKRYYGISSRLPLVPTSLLIRTIMTRRPYPIRALFLQGTNPLISYAGATKVFEALQRLDFLAVADLFMTPTAALADVVLPAATNMEFNDIGHYGLPHGYVLARPGIVDPPGECWPDAEMINELGKRMGYAEFFWPNLQQCLEEILAPSGLSYEKFCQKGQLKGKMSYRKYEESGFKTPSGKVELYSSAMEKEGAQPLPVPSPIAFEAEPDSLLLINSKPKHFFHSGYRQIESLRHKENGPFLRIHPLTAERFGVSEGTAVAVSTSQGQITLSAKLTDRIHPWVVKADYGWWFPEGDDGSLFRWRQSNLNLLTSGDPPYDRVLGTTALRAIPCRISSLN